MWPLFVPVCVSVFFSQSQLSACSKALESSEELLELANQTLCSSETDGFTQVTDPCRRRWCHTAALFPLLALWLMVDFTVHIYDLICPLGVMLPAILTKPPATFFCVQWQHDGLRLSYLFAPYLSFSFPSLLLLSRRPKTLRIGIVLSHPLLPICHSLL